MIFKEKKLLFNKIFGVIVAIKIKSTRGSHDINIKSFIFPTSSQLLKMFYSSFPSSFLVLKNFQKLKYIVILNASNFNLILQL